MSHLEKFEALCNDGQELNAALARQIVLAKTNGMCDPSLLLNEEDGTVLNLRRLCKKTESIVKKRSWSWKKEISLDEFAHAMMNKEDGLSLNRRAKILSTFSQNHKDVSSLRSALLRNSTHKTIAIHFFKWDGSCRTAEEIQQAIMKYPNDRRFLLKVIAVAVAGTVGLGAALYVRSRMSPHAGPPTNPSPHAGPQINPSSSRRQDTKTGTKIETKDYVDFTKKPFFGGNNFALENIDGFLGFPECAHTAEIPSKSCQRALIKHVNQLPHGGEVFFKTPLEIETFFLAFRDQILKILKIDEFFHHFQIQDGIGAANDQYDKAKRGEISFETVNRQFNEKTYAAGPYYHKSSSWGRGAFYWYMYNNTDRDDITPNAVRFLIHSSWEEGPFAYNALFKKHFRQPLLDWFYKYR